MRILLEGVSKSFGPTHVIEDLDLEVRDGEMMALLGPSGCGKTTTLLSICGIHRISAGRILFGEREVGDWPPQRRNVGVVFQNYALYPHLTVYENIAFPLRVRKESHREIDAKITGIVSILRVGELLDRRPAQLSGGQRQRVAIARTLAAEPSLLIMDEPLSALDEPTRERILWDISALKERFAIPMLYVTHNLREAYSLADRVVVIDQGKVIEKGAREDILERPAHFRTAQCVGIENLFPCRVLNFVNGEMKVQMGEKEISLHEDARFRPGERAYLGISPPDVRLSVAPEDRPNTLTATVVSIMERKNIMVVHVKIFPDGPRLVADIQKHFLPKWGLASGSPVYVSLTQNALFLCRE
ncbi:MAG: ABC transporter ATP-binding protein [Nitrospinota bacterium]|nr:ABC transporter ATP-binding protein [Nitrospinota bacterium]